MLPAVVGGAGIVMRSLLPVMLKAGVRTSAQAAKWAISPKGSLALTAAGVVYSALPAGADPNAPVVLPPEVEGEIQDSFDLIAGGDGVLDEADIEAAEAAGFFEDETMWGWVTRKASDGVEAVPLIGDPLQEFFNGGGSTKDQLEQAVRAEVKEQDRVQQAPMDAMRLLSDWASASGFAKAKLWDRVLNEVTEEQMQMALSFVSVAEQLLAKGVRGSGAVLTDRTPSFGF